MIMTLPLHCLHDVPVRRHRGVARECPYRRPDPVREQGNWKTRHHLEQVFIFFVISLSVVKLFQFQSLSEENALELGIFGEMYHHSTILVEKCAKLISVHQGILKKDWN